MPRSLTREELNRISGQIIDSAIKIHSRLGSGLLESAYQKCLAYELRNRGFDVKENYPIPIVYEELHIAIAYRTDLLVNDAVIAELKTADSIADEHEAQLQTQLNFGGFRLGLLINFRAPRLKEGIRRRVNNF